MTFSEAPMGWESFLSKHKPLLVVPVYRGGDRFQRCLLSIKDAGEFFAGVVLSINSSVDSQDMERAILFQKDVDFPVDVFNTGSEVNSMNHTRFWAQQLLEHRVPSDQFIMWLGHDDELDVTNLAQLCPGKSWSIAAKTMVLGPWKLRHESVDEIYKVPHDEVLETWTCFPNNSQFPLKSMDWVCDQLLHPTYLNLTGGIFPLRSVCEILEFRVHKASGMRMEMTLATSPNIEYVTELPEPITIVYGRADSDRATIPRRDAVRDDRHLLLWLTRYTFFTPGSRKRFLNTMSKIAHLRFKVVIGKAELPQEDWAVRGG